MKMNFYLFIALFFFLVQAAGLDAKESINKPLKHNFGFSPVINTSSGSISELSIIKKPGALIWVVDTMYNGEYDQDNQDWVYTKRTGFSYDDAGRLSEKITRDWFFVDWSLDFIRTVITYQDNPNTMEETFIAESDTSTEKAFLKKNTHTYDSDNREVLLETIVHQDGVWLPSERNETEFHESGNITSFLRLKANSDLWDTVYKFINIFDEEGYLTRRVEDINEDSTAHYETDYIWTESEYEDTITAYKTTVYNWLDTLRTREVTVLNSFGMAKLQTISEITPESGGEYVDKEQYIWVYDNNGILLNSFVKLWYDYYWHSYIAENWWYDDFGNITRHSLRYTDPKDENILQSLTSEEFVYKQITSVEAGKNTIIVHAFPNPAINDVNISCDLGYQEIKGIVFYNLSGDIAREIPASDIFYGDGIINVDISGLVQGVYYFELISTDKVQQGNIVISK